MTQTMIGFNHTKYINSMTFGSESRRLFKKLDKFCTTQLLRYKEETEYATYTGACLSVILVVLMVLIAGTVILQTINREKINSSSSITLQPIPSNITLSFSTFKFGIQLAGVNLSDTTKSYFDILVTEEGFANSAYTRKYYNVSQCREEQWQVNQQVSQAFSYNHGSDWLCPVQNQSVTVGGSYASQTSHVISIDVYECGAYHTGKTNCATDDEVSDLIQSNGGFLQFNVYTVNTVVQPGQKEPILHYLDDTKTVIFGEDIGQVSVIQIAQYQLKTDNSLMPWKSIETIEGLFIRQKNDLHARSIADSSRYSSFLFTKSKAKFTHQRSYYKLDQLFSYVGGLIAMTVALFIFFLPYTELCYEFSLCNQLFVDHQGKPLHLSFNFLKYLFYQAYDCFTYFFSCCKIEEYQLYKTCSTEVQRQLDVAYLYKRINTLERVVTEHRLTNDLPYDPSYHKMSFSEAQAKRESVCTLKQDQELRQQLRPSNSSTDRLYSSSESPCKLNNGKELPEIINSETTQNKCHPSDKNQGKSKVIEQTTNKKGMQPTDNVQGSERPLNLQEQMSSKAQATSKVRRSSVKK